MGRGAALSCPAWGWGTMVHRALGTGPGGRGDHMGFPERRAGREQDLSPTGPAEGPVPAPRVSHQVGSVTSAHQEQSPPRGWEPEGPAPQGEPRRAPEPRVRRAAAFQAPPLTCSVRSFLAPRARGPGHGWGRCVSYIRSASHLGSRGSGHPALVLLHRGSGIEPRTGLGLQRWWRLWARGARRGGAGVHPAEEKSPG